MRPNSVRLEPPHKKLYKTLFAQGTTISPARQTVQQTFGLLRPHTRQAIKGWGRRDNISIPMGKGQRQRLKKRAQVNIQDNGYDMEAQIDLTIEAFEALRMLPKIQAELIKTTRANELLKSELESYRTYENKRKDQENRFRVAQQQGDLHNNFTEHIRCDNLKSELRLTLPLDISEGDFLFN